MNISSSLSRQPDIAGRDYHYMISIEGGPPVARYSSIRPASHAALMSAAMLCLSAAKGQTFYRGDDPSLPPDRLEVLA